MPGMFDDLIPAAAPTRAAVPGALPMSDVPTTFSAQATTARTLQNQKDTGQIATIPLTQANTAVNIRQGEHSIANQTFDQKEKFRDDYNQQPEVKNYSLALPSAIAAFKTAPNPQGDLSLIYAAAKVFDPPSVVRGSEQDAVGNTQPIIQQIAARYGKEVLGGGTFTEEARTALRHEVQRRLGILNQAYIGQRVRYKHLAQEEGFDPQSIVGDHQGTQFQDEEAQFLGHPITKADFNGHVIPGSGANVSASGVDLSTGNDGMGASITAPKVLNSSGQVSTDIPKAMADENAAFMAQHPRGKLDAQDYAAFREHLDSKYGYISSPASEMIKFAKAYNSPGGVDLVIPGAIEKQGIAGQIANTVAQSPVGTAGINAGNTALLGIPELLAGSQGRENLHAINEENGPSALLGQVVGGAIGAKGAGSLATAAAEQFAPALLRGGTRAALARTIGKEVVTNAVTGANDAEAGSRLKAAAIGGAVGGAGGLVGNVLGKGATPLASEESKAALEQLKNVDLTTAQRLGDTAASAEESLQGVPIIRGARQKAQDSMNLDIANRALASTGDSVPKGVKAGVDAVEYVRNSLNNGYNKVYGKITGKLDATFDTRMDALHARTVQDLGGSELSADLGKKLNQLDNFVDMASDANGAISGKSVKRSVEQLRNYGATWGKSEDPDLRRLGQLAENYADQVHRLAGRQNPGVTTALNNLDTGWARYVRLNKAAGLAANEGGVASPAQYMSAIRSADSSVRKSALGRGKALDQEYAGAANLILGKGVPSVGSPWTTGLALGVTGLSGAGSILAPIAVGAGATAAYTPGVKRLTQALLSGARPGLPSVLQGKGIPSTADLLAALAAAKTRDQ